MSKDNKNCLIKNNDIYNLKPNENFNCDIEQGAILRISEDMNDSDKKIEHKKIHGANKMGPGNEPENEEEIPVGEEDMGEQPEEPVVNHSVENAKSGKKVKLHSEVGVSSSDVADLSQITGLAANNSGTGIIMALIAVAGGGAAWKFYSQYSSQKHEENMARLEKEDSSHKECEAKRLELKGQISALESKLNQVQSSFDVNAPSTSDLEKKIKSLERKLKSTTKISS